MLKIQRSSNGQVTYMLSGQIEEEDIDGLEAIVRSEAKGRRIVFDLRNLTLVGQDAIAFLDRCEANGITLRIAQHTSASGSRGNEGRVRHRSARSG